MTTASILQQLEDSEDAYWESMSPFVRYLYQLVLDNNIKKVVEIGTGRAVSTTAIALGLCETSGHIYTIDIVRNSNGSARLQTYSHLLPYITCIIGDSKVVSLIEHIDLLFIDGSHYYDDALNDLTRWGEQVVCGGYIVLHDYNAGDVTDAVATYLCNNNYCDFSVYQKSVGLGLIKRRGSNAA